MNVRISVPTRIKRGDVVQIKTLAAHPMETGFRRDNLGNVVPRDILVDFTCTFDASVVFSAQLHPAVAANPYIAFSFKASQSGTLTFTWRDQAGKTTQATREVSIID